MPTSPPLPAAFPQGTQPVLFLDPPALTALELVLVGEREHGAVAEPCHLKLNHLFGHKGGWSRQVYRRLQEAGLVYPGRAHYREVYRLPPALRCALLHLLGLRISRPPEAAQPAASPKTPALLDLAVLFARVRTQPARLTRRGNLYRRQEVRLLEALAAPEDGRRPGPSLVDFLLQFAQARGLIRSDDQALAVTPAGLDWIRQPEVVQWRDLVGWAVSALTKHHTFGAVWALLAAVPGKRWVALSRLEDLLLKLSPDPFWAGLRKDLRDRLYLLEELGLFERAADGAFGRLTPLAKAWAEGKPLPVPPLDGAAYVEGDFTVIVHGHLPPEALLRLEEMADLVRADSARLYRITRSSLFRALKAGRELPEIEALLARICPHPLPQNVVAALQDWGRAFGRSFLAEVTLLRVDDRQLADRLLATPRLAPYFLGRLSPRDLLVDPDRVGELRAALEEEGYPPRPGIVRYGPQDARDTRDLRTPLEGATRE